MWNYYENINKRVEVVGNFLKSLKKMEIVDLNCGKAPLYQLLDRHFIQYTGNDILDDFPQKDLDLKGTFVQQDDVSFAKDYKERMWGGLNELCLVLLGHSGYPKHKDEHESNTVNEAMNSLVELQPAYIVIESVEHFTNTIDDEIVKNMRGYDLVLNEYLDLGLSWVEKRRVRIWKKEKKEKK